MSTAGGVRRLQLQSAGGETAFLSCHPALVRAGARAPVDFFTRGEDPPHYALELAQGALLSEELSESWAQSGVKALYYRREDEAAFYAYVEKHAASLLREGDVPLSVLWPALYNTACLVMDDAFNDPTSARNLRRTSTVLDVLLRAMRRGGNPQPHIRPVISRVHFTSAHCVNVCLLLADTARELLGVTDPLLLKEIARGGLLHDLGKSQVPPEILYKNGRLTPDERRLIERHPVTGLALARRIPHLTLMAASIIRNHHERFDGRGYPDGLKGAQIKPVVALSAVADVFDALTAQRPYAEALSAYAALELMVKQMQGHFEMRILRAFIQYLGPQCYRNGGSTHRPLTTAAFDQS